MVGRRRFLGFFFVFYGCGSRSIVGKWIRWEDVRVVWLKKGVGVKG